MSGYIRRIVEETAEEIVSYYEQHSEKFLFLSAVIIKFMAFLEQRLVYSNKSL